MTAELIQGLTDWAQRGIVSRGVLLDLVSYYTRDGGKLPYDPWTTNAITVKDLLEVAAFQGVTFRQGDILLLRVGFMQRYYASSQEEKDQLGAKPETLSVFVRLNRACLVHILLSQHWH